MSKTVTFGNLTIGTKAVQLAQIACKKVLVKADDNNSGVIYLGDSAVMSSQGFALKANQAIAFEVDNLRDVWVVASTTAQLLYFAAEVEG